MFLKIYMVLEILWLGFYIGAVSGVYGLNLSDDVKSDVTRLDTHILTPITVLTVAYSKRPFLWIFPFYIFIMFRESINVAEITYFSNLKYSVDLWRFSVFVVSYQSALTLGSFIWYITRNRLQKIPIKINL